MGAIVLALLVAGCGQPSGAPPGPVVEPGSAGESLWGTEYVLSEVTVAGKPYQLVAGTTVSLTFTDDGRLRAHAGCNSMSGRVSLDGGTLTTDGLAVTGIGCPQPRHEQDAWLVDFLSGGPSWKQVDGSRLVLHGEDTELVLTDREVAEPDQPLVGPVWTVDTIVDGQVASSSATGTSAATVEFGEDRVTVFTGCNGGSAEYTVSGDTIAFEALVLTTKACAEDVMRVEDAVVAVLDGTVTYSVDSTVLTLDHPSGSGLRLRTE